MVEGAVSVIKDANAIPEFGVLLNGAGGSADGDKFINEQYITFGFGRRYNACW
jgi:hypothetical protein